MTLLGFHTDCIISCDHIRLFLASELYDFADLQPKLNKLFQGFVSFQQCIILIKFLEINPDGDPDRASPTLPEYHSGAIREQEPDSLVL